MKGIAGLLTALVSLFLVGCTAETDVEVAKGGFAITLTDDPVVVTSRATPEEIGKPMQEDFQLKVVKNDVNMVAYDGKFVPVVVPLTPGIYTLKATCGENVPLGWDKPYYEGSLEAEVLDGSPTPVTIPCSVKNSLVSVVFTNPEIYDQLYSEYGLKVSVGNNSLIITPERAAESAYFPADSDLKLNFVGTTKVGAKADYSLTEFLQDKLPLGAAQHAKLHLTASNVGISVTKVEVENVSVSETIPLEWLPKPKASAEGFADNVLEFVETERKDAVISYAVASPVQDAVITLNFNAPQNPDLMVLNGTYTLSTITAEQRSKLQSMGVVLPFMDATTCEVNLTGVTERMQTDNGATTNNTVTVNVKANNRWSNGDKEQGTGDVFTMKVKKPELTIAVQPGNVWSKEFTIDEVIISSGKKETILANFKYQYSSDGGNTWQDCSSGGRLHQFASHPTQKTYKVRASYRGAVHTAVHDVTLETPTQIPNSNMESWSTKEVASWGWFTKTHAYEFLPYNSGESDIWWATNNEYSQDGNVVAGIGDERCFSPCVSYTESIKHGGSRAALIYTTGHGGNYASTGEILYPASATAGNLFIGSYNWSDKTETINTGHSFSVRPTKINFWYRYTPKNSDQFKVYIELRNGSTVIASGQYIPTAYSTADSEFKQVSVNLEYSIITQKATSVYIQFLSTTKTSFESADFTKKQSITFPVMGSWSAHIGSMLYIDDLSLEFDK